MKKHAAAPGQRTMTTGTTSPQSSSAAPAFGFPAVVQEVLGAPGGALDPATRSDMEGRFGHDFSRVRVYADSRAAEAAAAVNAHAFALGHQVVFGAGRYAPGTRDGQRLLAHELTHVLQQGAGGHSVQRASTAADSVGQPGDGHELEADRVAEEFMRGPRESSGVGLSAPRALTWTAAAPALQLQPAPAQQPAAPALPDNLAAYPENERLRITVSTTPLGGTSATAINDAFSPPPSGGFSTLTNTTVVINASIPAAQHRGLHSVAAELVAGLTPSPLSLNTTISVAIARAGAVFRFTHFTHRISRTVTEDLVLIEHIAALPAAAPAQPAPATPATTAPAQPAQTPPAQPAPPAATQPARPAAPQTTQPPASQPAQPATAQPAQPATAQPAAPAAAQPAVQTPAQIGAQRFTAHNYRFGSGWPTVAAQRQQELDLLHEALARMPDSMLIDGITWVRGGTHPTNPNECGEYDPNANSITLFNCAFDAQLTRYGAATNLMQSIAHELGHGEEGRPLDQAFTAFNAAGQSAAARRTLFGVRSPAGRRWQLPAGTGTFIQAEVPSDFAVPFRQAAQQDGVQLAPAGTTTLVGTAATLTRGITSYANTNWQEFYAEAFSMYASDPDLLRLIRPHIYDFFARRFPDPTRPPRPAPARPAPRAGRRRP